MDRGKFKLKIKGSPNTGRRQFSIHAFNALQRYKQPHHRCIYTRNKNKNTIKLENASDDIIRRNVLHDYFRYTLGIFIIFSVTDRCSFSDVDWFMRDIMRDVENSREIPFIALIGNKCDLKEKREVSYEVAKNLADRYGILYAEVSAKTGYNIGCIIQLLYKAIKGLSNKNN